MKFGFSWLSPKNEVLLLVLLRSCSGRSNSAVKLLISASAVRRRIPAVLGTTLEQDFDPPNVFHGFSQSVDFVFSDDCEENGIEKWTPNGAPAL
jgi:hypothetical protein